MNGISLTGGLSAGMPVYGVRGTSDLRHSTLPIFTGRSGT
ncbi:MAG: hypothetical protein JWQ50_4578 [Caballeronia mineralivorans]|jgi:hypothetical protein|nr:hypothetical protein [Caballeronia mineralivorans]